MTTGLHARYPAPVETNFTENTTQLGPGGWDWGNRRAFTTRQHSEISETVQIQRVLSDVLLPARPNVPSGQ